MLIHFAMTVVNCFNFSIFSEHSQGEQNEYSEEYVVNCFNFSIFSEHSQVLKLLKVDHLGCELL